MSGLGSLAIYNDPFAWSADNNTRERERERER